jgi:hypothetical protein
MVEEAEAETAIPKDLLHRHVVDAEGLAGLDVGDGFVERETVGVEGY